MTLAAVCVVVAAFYFGRPVLIPLALAILLAFLMAPLAALVEKSGLGRVASVVLVVIAALILFGLLGWLIGVQARSLARDLNSYRQQGIVRWRDLLDKVAISHGGELIGEMTGTATTRPALPGLGTVENPMFVVVQSAAGPEGAIEQVIASIAAGAGLIAPLIIAVPVGVLVIFMLLAREDLRDRMIRLIGQGQMTLTTQAIDEAASRVSRYLLAQFAINFAFGLVVTLGLWLIGIKDPLLWGLLCGVLRFIPYIGIFIGAAGPVLLSMILFGGAAKPVETIGLFVFVEIAVAQFIEPWLYGARIGVSPMALLLAAAFWTWLWGPIGLFLSTPLTVCLAVMGKYVPQLQFIDILLGDRPVLAPCQRYYQRLLGEHPDQALELILQNLKEHSLQETYETVIIPAAKMAQSDRRRGRVEEASAQMIEAAMFEQVDQAAEFSKLQSAKKIAEQAAAGNDKEGPAPAPAPAPAPVAAAANPRAAITIICLPARDKADEIAARALARILEHKGFKAAPISADLLAGEMLQAVDSQKAHLLAICALPPGAVGHCRYPCKRLRERYPEIPLVACLWHARIDPTRAAERMGDHQPNKIATDFSKTIDCLTELAEGMILKGNGK